MPGGSRFLAPVVAVAALTALVACGTTTEPAPAPQGQDHTSIAETQQTHGGIVDGYSVTVPKLNETSNLVALGLNPDKTIEVPRLDQPMQAGLYMAGPKPGEVGPAVILAHVNAHGQQGFGEGFHLLAPGDPIDTTTPTGVVHYKVTSVATFAKDAYPTARVYSDTKGPELRLITCGGDLDQVHHNYLSNVVVFAQKA